MNIIDSNERRWMRKMLFLTLLALFILTTLLTLGALFFGLGELTPHQESILTGSCLTQTASAVFLLFRNLFARADDDKK